MNNFSIGRLSKDPVSVCVCDIIGIHKTFLFWQAHLRKIVIFSSLVAKNWIILVVHS